MAFVLDAAVTACWAFSDERNPDAFAALTRLQGEEALVPALWWFEIRNVLLVNERRKRLTEAEVAEFLTKLAGLPIRIEALSAGDLPILETARRHSLTVYDAAYLELAVRNGLGLATLDSELIRAARKAGVPLIMAEPQRSRRPC